MWVYYIFGGWIVWVVFWFEDLFYSVWYWFFTLFPDIEDITIEFAWEYFITLIRIYSFFQSGTTFQTMVTIDDVTVNLIGNISAWAGNCVGVVLMIWKYCLIYAEEMALPQCVG